MALSPGPNPFTFGGVTLFSTDCPTELSIGTGNQRMAVTETVGGGKSVHVTGFQPDTNTWSGRLHQPLLDSVVANFTRFMVDGLERQVTWKQANYYGIVRSFKPTFKKGGQICDWTLSVEITRDGNGAFSTATPLPTIDYSLGTLGDTIDVATQAIISYQSEQAANSTVLAQLTDTYNADVTASQAAITAITPTALASASSIASTLAAVQKTVASLAPVISLLPNGSSVFLSATQGLAALQLTNAALNTVQSQATKQQTGGSLFATASTSYGDIYQAFTIMQASGIVSPILHGSQPTTVVLPPAPATPTVPH